MTGTIRQALGAYGETLATRYLVGQGMRLLACNWRCSEGEIDLVLRDGDVLVVVEVKTRTDVSHGTPHEAVDDAKLERLRRLAVCWSREHQVQPPEIRVDLVAVLRPRRGPSVLEHVRGIG